MLGGLTSYGSDSDSDGESKQPTPPPTRAPTTSLPAPKESAPKPPTGSLSSSLALPPPKKRRDGPVRITVEAPKFDDEDEDSARTAKKARTVPSLGSGTKGAGSSSLFSALPAPKNATPVLPEPKRVLGGGGGPALNFSSSVTANPTSSDVQASASEDTKSTSNGLFLPPSMAKAKAKAAAPPPAIESAPAIDFFSLGSTSSATTSAQAPSASQTSSITLMSAPDVKDFEPPMPSLFDPYPGYYQLPSGEWAAHDPAFYKKVMNQLISGVDPQAEAGGIILLNKPPSGA